MIDSRDATATTDPDPGCSSPTDTSENSEVPSPATCDIQVGIFDERPAAARAPAPRAAA